MVTQGAVEVVDYDPAWPVLFAEIEPILRAALGDLVLVVEHVGSTSVPGLAAKPILDIDVVIPSRERLPEAAICLSRLGYLHRGDLGVPDREAFGREDEQTPRDGTGRRWPHHHLYVCPRESRELARHLAFRDYLRRHPEEALAYARLKKDLALRFTLQREAYGEGKTEFVERIYRLLDLS
jgi:GrpB-like predicted nucleotidyltransferase (UPF0157 family)